MVLRATQLACNPVESIHPRTDSSERAVSANKMTSLMDKVVVLNIVVGGIHTE